MEASDAVGAAAVGSLVGSAAPAASADVASDVATAPTLDASLFTCASWSPANAANAAPAKNDAAKRTVVSARRFFGASSGCSCARESKPYSQVSVFLKSLRCGMALVAPSLERRGRHTGADSSDSHPQPLTVRVVSPSQAPGCS